MPIEYEPNANDALGPNYIPRRFVDPGPTPYQIFNEARVDSKYFLKPIQDELMALIQYVYGDLATYVIAFDEALYPGPVCIAGWDDVSQAVKIVPATDTCANFILTTRLEKGAATFVGQVGNFKSCDVETAERGTPVFVGANGKMTVYPPNVRSKSVGWILYCNDGTGGSEMTGIDATDATAGCCVIKGFVDCCGGLTEGSITTELLAEGAVDSIALGAESVGPRTVRYGGWHNNLLNSAHSITTGYDQEGANYVMTQWCTFDNALFTTSRVLTVGPAAAGWEFTIQVSVAQFIDVFFPIGGQHLLYGGAENTNATSNTVGASITFHFGTGGWFVKSMSNPADWSIHS